MMNTEIHRSKAEGSLFTCALALLAALPLLAADKSPEPGLPFVYTKWKQLTTKDGLPNDHIFAVKADPFHDCIWVGTEGGLARYDKKTGKIRSWREADGLPWRVITAIDVDPKTGDVWLGLFGGGLARFSSGRFDHFHQLNSGLANDVVYGIAVENDNIWCATTAGASRYNVKKDKWDIFTEKNAPMEEIWNYNVAYRDGKVHLAVWGSGVLEFDIKTENWKTYLDPDGEMEIDLYRDDGIVHVITTGASYIEKTLWISTYFGCCRYDGRHWRGYFDHDCGLPSNFNNNVKGRSAQEAWFCSDKGLGACMDAETCTWVTYTSDGDKHTGKAVIKRENEVIKVVDTGYNVPHNFQISVDFDGADVWAGTSKGLGHGIGEGYYPRLRPAGATLAQAKTAGPPSPPRNQSSH
ncbi:MAG: regulator [Verrucomicrobiota bacterium]|jgi:ligand-binding sensor domain-containing protein